MKKIILVAAVAFFTTTISAQKAKDSLLNLIASEVCTELTKDSASIRNSKDMETQMGMAFLPSLGLHQEALQAYYDIDAAGDGKGFNQLGIDVGMRMTSACPGFMKMILQKTAQEKETVTAPVESEKLSTVSGTLIKVVPGDLTYISMKDDRGKIQKIWWFEYFEGAEKLTPAMNNKPVKLQYYEKEVYNGLLGEYIKIKIAAGVQ